MTGIRRLATYGTSFTELERMGGTTALGLLAIKNLHIQFMHLLSMSVDAVRSLNTRDLYGNTPMHYWALRGQEAYGILSQLEELGGDVYCPNMAGETPRSVVASGGITCKEPNVRMGARFCSLRKMITVVEVD